MKTRQFIILLCVVIAGFIILGVMIDKHYHQLDNYLYSIHQGVMDVSADVYFMKYGLK